jgi:hypothetical protein
MLSNYFVNAILESLAVQADIVSGVPRQIPKLLLSNGAVENVKVKIYKPGICIYLLEEMFRDIDRCLNSVQRDPG